MTCPREVASTVQRLDRPESGERLRAVAELRSGLDELESSCVAEAVPKGCNGSGRRRIRWLLAPHGGRPAARAAASGDGSGRCRRVAVSTEIRRAVKLAR